MSWKKDRARRNRHKDRLFKAQDGRCYLCPDAMRRRTATSDHVTPRIAGGRWAGNMLLAHRLCNQRKGERLPHPCEVIYLAAINARLGVA